MRKERRLTVAVEAGEVNWIAATAPAAVVVQRRDQSSEFAPRRAA